MWEVLYIEAFKRSSCFQEKAFLQFVEVRRLKAVASVSMERYQNRHYARKVATLFYSYIQCLHFVTGASPSLCQHPDSTHFSCYLVIWS